MNFKNIEFYPEFWIDCVIFVFIAVLLCFVSKWIWEYKEEKRLLKESAEYQQRKEDEALEESR